MCGVGDGVGVHPPPLALQPQQQLTEEEEVQKILDAITDLEQLGAAQNKNPGVGARAAAGAGELGLTGVERQSSPLTGRISRSIML